MSLESFFKRLIKKSAAYLTNYPYGEFIYTVEKFIALTNNTIKIEEGKSIFLHDCDGNLLNFCRKYIFIFYINFREKH